MGSDHMPGNQSWQRYDWRRSYAWNYARFPQPASVEVPHVAGSWDYCGLSVDSPLGVPAGPLLNRGWCLYYASLGFDVLTYKTVRSRSHGCYDLPNLQPVEVVQPLVGGESRLSACDVMQGSWAVSFGMPSRSPDEWRADVEQTRNELPEGKILSVSVVATIQPGWSIKEVAEDYALCARWAVDSGADCVETNFSCPNVSTCDGQLYQEPEAAGYVASAVRQAIGDVPYIIKVGHLRTRVAGEALLDAVAPYVDAIAMTNSIATTVQKTDRQLLFAGQKRGICGAAISAASIEQTHWMCQLIGQREENVRLIGVGGVRSLVEVNAYMDAGAHAVQLATAAMTDPAIGLRLRRAMSYDTWRSTKIS